MNKLILIASSLFLLQGCFVKENPVSSSMKGDSFLKEILKNKENYEIQIIYTEIKRDKEGEPDFMDFEFQVDENNYFYPASTIKLPIVILTLDKINELRSKGINVSLKSKITLSPLDQEMSLIQKDSITSFQNLIADILLVSDNSASNVLIDFIGYNHFNAKMNQAGFNKTYLNHKFSPDPNYTIDWEIKTMFNDLISSNEKRDIVKADDNILGLKKGEKKFKDGIVELGSLDFLSLIHI